MNARDSITQMIERTKHAGRWPTTAELAQLRHDNARLAKALNDVLDLCASEVQDTSSSPDLLELGIIAMAKDVQRTIADAISGAAQ